MFGWFWIRSISGCPYLCQTMFDKSTQNLITLGQYFLQSMYSECPEVTVCKQAIYSIHFIYRRLIAD